MGVALEWQRPAFLFLLLAVPVFLLLAWRRRDPLQVATGAFRLWDGLASTADASRRKRFELPPGFVWFVLAWCAGALLLADPLFARAQSAKPIDVVLDTSPSMFLQDSGGTTRFDSGWSAARAWLDAKDGGAERRFLAWDGLRFREAFSAEPPAEFRELSLCAGRTPFEEHDRLRTLWFTDGIASGADPLVPEFASLIATGGEAVPGPVALAPGGALVIWDGRALVRSVVENRFVVKLSGETPPVLQRLAEAFCLARELALDTGVDTGVDTGGNSRGETVLTIATVSSELSEPAEMLSTGRDGWHARLQLRSSNLEPTIPDPGDELWTRWLAAGERPIVRWRKGEVELHAASFELAPGDESAFALSFARLFDSALRQPRGIVALEERQALDPFQPPSGLQANGERPAATVQVSGEHRVVQLALALAAAACAFMCLFTRRLLA